MNDYTKDIGRVREMFSADRFATLNGMVIDEIGDHYAKCSVVIDERHLNAMGGVMGGVHFTLADFAFAVASNWQEPGTVGLNTTISYVGPVKGTKLTAEARLVKNGRSTCCYSIQVTDDLGNIAAAVQCMGFHKR